MYPYFLFAAIHHLRNLDGDAEDNVDWKINLYYTYGGNLAIPPRCGLDHLVCLCQSWATKLNLEHIDKSEIAQFKKLVESGFDVLQTSTDLGTFERCSFTVGLATEIVEPEN